MKMKLIRNSLILFSLLVFLGSCAQEGGETGEIIRGVVETTDSTLESTPTVVDSITDTTPESTTNIVTLDSPISTPAASLVIRITGNDLPYTNLTATILGEGNDCGEYKLSNGFNQGDTEVQLDAPLECLTEDITTASQISFSQNLDNVAVTTLENEGGGNLTLLASGSIGNPPAISRTLVRNFTEGSGDDVIDLADVVYLYAYIQGTRDTVENLTAAGQALLPSLEKPATVLPTAIFDNFTESPTDSVIDLVDVILLFAYFQGATGSLAELEAAAKALLPSITVSPSVMPKPTGFETSTLVSPIGNVDAGSLVIRITGTDLPFTEEWKAHILGLGNNCGGLKLSSGFTQSSTEIYLDAASLDCILVNYSDISQITFNQELNGATVTLLTNQGGGNLSTVGSSVSSDTTSPSGSNISINGGDASTTDPSVTLSLTTSDDVSVAAYFVSENDSIPLVTAPAWVFIAETANFSGSVPFLLSNETEAGNYAKTVYAWYKDTSDNLSSSVSDSITLVIEETNPSTVPSRQAGGISFVDADLSVGELAGDMVITKASDESDITHYVLYWGSDATTKLTGQSSIVSLPKTETNLTHTFPNNTTIPIDATHLLVFTKNDIGEMSTGIAFQFVDNFLQTGGLEVAAGAKHTCALLSDGTIKCWGKGSSGQLGNGSTSSSSVPVTVSGISTAVNVSARSYHNCATLNNGIVQCWGKGASGRLGNGSKSDSSVPTAVSNISTATQVSVGKEHSCALLSNGTVQCWGKGSSGQLGNGSTKTSLVPVTVNGITSAVGISAGNKHTCAVLSDGSVQCWGKGYYKVLGQDNTKNSKVPVTVTDLSSVVEVSAGGYHNCARINDGTLKCWGHGKSGQLGNGSNANYSLPVSVSGISSAAEVSAGSYHTCARLTDGKIKCWGSGSHGRLGNGNTQKSNVPVSVNNVASAVDISAGSEHSCAVSSAVTIQCWGRGSNGRLGNGGTANASTPVYVTGFSGVSISDGLVASYSFDGNATDVNGAANGATHGNITYSTGKVGQAAVFDGSSYITTPLISNLSGGVGFTISVWVNLTGNLVGVNQIIEAYASTPIGDWENREIYLETISNGSQLQFAYAGNFIDSPTLSTDSWQHVVITYDGTSQIVYVNGSLVKEEAASGDITVVTGFSIGRDYEANFQFLTGMIDELQIYNRAISLSEVQALYSGSGSSSSSGSGSSFSAAGTVGGETIDLNSSAVYAKVASNQFRIYGNDINFEFEFENLIPTQTGTYTIGTDFNAVDFANEDSQYNLHAYEGSVTITAVSPKFEGTFTLTKFATGHGGTPNLSANISGSFSVDPP